MSFLDHIGACNNADLSQFMPFVTGGQRIGWLDRSFAASLAAWPAIFVAQAEQVGLTPELDDFASRSAAASPPCRPTTSAASSCRTPTWRLSCRPARRSRAGRTARTRSPSSRILSVVRRSF